MADRTEYEVDWVDYASMKKDAEKLSKEKKIELQEVLDNILDYCPSEHYHQSLTFPSLEQAFSWAEKNHDKCAFNQPRVSVYEITEATFRDPEEREEIEAWYVVGGGTEEGLSREEIELD